MRKNRVFLVIIIIVALLVALKLVFFPGGNGQAPAPQAGKGQTPPSAVTAYLVSTQKLDNSVFASGTVMSNEEVELRPEVSGKVMSLNIKEGLTVKKGTLLVKINDADLQAQLKKLNIQIRLAADRERRSAQLLEAKGISQDEYEQALNQLNTLKADVDYTRAQIEKTEIRAPFDGVIGLKYISDGAYVTPTTKIATYQQVDPLKIDFSLPERYFSRVERNDPVKFSVAGLRDTITGYIYAIEPKIDPVTRTVQVRALCPNRNVKIFPGAFARVQVILKETPNALMVPTQAIIPILKGQKVFVVKGGKAVEARIETGIRTESMVQVISGLSQGDTVITTGIMSLRPGVPVAVQKLEK